MATKTGISVGKKSDKPRFFEIKDEATVSKVLDSAYHSRAPVTIWLKDQSIKFNSRIVQFAHHLKLLSFYFPATVSETKFLETVKAQKRPEVFGTFSIEGVNFFFKVEFYSKTDKNAFQTPLPVPMFKLQRRANLRITLKREQAPRVTFFDPEKYYRVSQPISDKDLLAFRVVDISAGGLSFAIRPEEKSRFHSEQKLKDLRFRLRTTEINVDAVVRHVVDAKNDQGKPIAKVGIKFVGLKATHEKIIVQFVLDESRRVFSMLY